MSRLDELVKLYDANLVSPVRVIKEIELDYAEIEKNLFSQYVRDEDPEALRRRMRLIEAFPVRFRQKFTITSTIRNGNAVAIVDCSHHGFMIDLTYHSLYRAFSETYGIHVRPIRVPNVTPTLCEFPLQFDCPRWAGSLAYKRRTTAIRQVILTAYDPDLAAYAYEFSTKGYVAALEREREQRQTQQAIMDALQPMPAEICSVDLGYNAPAASRIFQL
jgi:hypothetical protein